MNPISARGRVHRILRGFANALVAPAATGRSLVLLLGCTQTLVMAQEWGTIDFRTHVPGVVDVRVWDVRTGKALEGGLFLGQLYMSTTQNGDYTAIGQPVPFGSGAEAGYLSGGEVQVPGAAPGSSCWVQVRAWGSDHPSYGSALVDSVVGRSDALIVGPLGGTVPAPLPSPGLAGLRPFLLAGMDAPPVVTSFTVSKLGSAVSLEWKVEKAPFGFPAWWGVAVQKADTPKGPWSDLVIAAQSPLTIEAVDSKAFYRIRVRLPD